MLLKNYLPNVTLQLRDLENPCSSSLLRLSSLAKIIEDTFAVALCVSAESCVYERVAPEAANGYVDYWL